MERDGQQDASTRRPTPLNGKAHAMRDGQSDLELDCVDCAVPDQETAWRGASGAAVFVENELAGVLRRCPPEFGQKKLLAVPICRLIHADGFAAAAKLQPGDERQHKELRPHIEMSLLRRLKALAESKDEWNVLLARLSVAALADPEKVRESVANKLLDDPGLVVELVGLWGDCMSGGRIPEATKVAEVQDLLFPLWLDPGVRRRLYHEVDANHSAIVFGAAASAVGAEQAAAHIQKRSTSWALRNGRVEGTSLFTFPSPLPKQPTIKSIATAFLRELATRILDPGFYPSALRAWLETCSGEVQQEISVDEEWAQYRRDLPPALKGRAVSRRDIPYFAMKLPHEEQSRSDRLEVLRMVKEVVLNLLIIELCDPERPNPQEIPIATWIHDRYGPSKLQGEN